MVGKVVSNTGATVQAQSILYKAIVQSGLLYDSESWVVTWSMIKVIEGFHWHCESDKFRLGEKCRSRQTTLQHCFESRQFLISVNSEPLELVASFQ